MIYKFSQGEHWVRDHVIDAPTLEDAKRIYKEYLDTGNEENVTITDPFYLGDIEDDLVIYDEEGNIFDENA